jgi:hypothetical protein
MYAKLASCTVGFIFVFALVANYVQSLVSNKLAVLAA